MKILLAILILILLLQGVAWGEEIVIGEYWIYEEPFSGRKHYVWTQITEKEFQGEKDGWILLRTPIRDCWIPRERVIIYNALRVEKEIEIENNYKKKEILTLKSLESRIEKLEKEKKDEKDWPDIIADTLYPTNNK